MSFLSSFLSDPPLPIHHLIVMPQSCANGVADVTVEVVSADQADATDAIVQRVRDGVLAWSDFEAVRNECNEKAHYPSKVMPIQCFRLSIRDLVCIAKGLKPLRCCIDELIHGTLDNLNRSRFSSPTYMASREFAVRCWLPSLEENNRESLVEVLPDNLCNHFRDLIGVEVESPASHYRSRRPKAALVLGSLSLGFAFGWLLYRHRIAIWNPIAKLVPSDRS